MDKPYIIGITGGSGSGKTSFIHAIQKQYSSTEIAVMTQDEYYLPREQQLTDENGIKDFDRPTCIDFDAMYSDVQKLIDGKKVERTEYVFNNELASPKLITYLPSPILIIEGLFVFHDERVKELLDLSIFIHAKENIKLIRRIKRDKNERNYPLEDVLYRYEHHVMPSYEKFIGPYMANVDLVINNNENFDKGLSVLTAHINSILSSSSK